MSPDDLQIASWSIVPDILKILEADFPHSIPAYRYLELYLKWKTEDVPDLDVFILTPGGKVDKYGTFILRAAEHRNNFVMYSLNPDVDQVKSLILNTNLIEWDKYPLWGPVCEKIYPLLNEVFAIKNLKKVFQDFEGHMFHLDKELAKEITYSCPPEVYIDQLKADEADIIDSYWPHRGGNSAEITRFVIKENGGVGLYDKETNELIAWVLIFMHNGPGQLFVMDKCKRKGYGTLVAKVASKLVAEKNIDPVAFIHVDNIASQKLFTNLGYKKLRKVYWCCATSVQN